MCEGKFDLFVHSFMLMKSYKFCVSFVSLSVCILYCGVSFVSLSVCILYGGVSFVSLSVCCFAVVLVLCCCQNCMLYCVFSFASLSVCILYCGVSFVLLSKLYALQCV